MWAPYNWVWRSLASASALGAEGRGFESHHLDCEWVVANMPVHNYNCIVNLLAVRTATLVVRRTVRTALLGMMWFRHVMYRSGEATWRRQHELP